MARRIQSDYSRHGLPQIHWPVNSCLRADAVVRRDERCLGIFHLDVRLRPHGGKSSLANVFEAGRDDCSPTGYAAPFERQALIKLRHIVGDVSLGRQMEAHRDSFVYGTDPWDIPGAVELRRQQLRQMVKPGQVNLKYSAGGLIDIEYAVQYLQVIHGHDHPSLRTPNTLQALAALVKEGLVS